LDGQHQEFHDTILEPVDNRSDAFSNYSDIVAHGGHRTAGRSNRSLRGCGNSRTSAGIFVARGGAGCAGSLNTLGAGIFGANRR
jgi:hypothetical protein